MPFFWPCNFFNPAFWKYKCKLVGCWPFNGKLGHGYISRALIISGYQAGISGGPPTTIGCCLGKKEEPYPDCSFALDISEEREYVTKGASRLGWPCYTTCELARALNHGQSFLLWMLYKGAYQNEDALISKPTLRKVSQYDPKVYGPAPCHA